MEKNDKESTIIIENESYKKFKNIGDLELIKSEIFICGFDIEDNSFFDSFVKEEIKISLEIRNTLFKKLKFFTDMIIQILNRTESFCRVNIILKNIHRNAPIAFYENILTYFYSMISIKAKFLESKTFVITFPQIFSYEFLEYTNNKNNNKDLLFNNESCIEKYLDEIINQNQISNFEISNSHNVFFVSAQSKYFQFTRNNKDTLINSEEEFDFIKSIIKCKLIVSESLKNIFYLDYINYYRDYIKFSKSEENFIKNEIKNEKSIIIFKLDLEHSLEFKVLKNIKSTNTHISVFEYENVCLGGSFDHIHIGHIMLLSLGCLSSSKSLSIGITSDNMISKKGNNSILQPYSLRKETVDFLTNCISKFTNLSIYPINDTCGEASQDANLNCLILTEETRKGGEFLNQERKKNSFQEVPFLFTNIIYTTKDYFRDDFHPEKKNNSYNSKISSSHLRNNIFNLIPEKNLVYLHKIWNEYLCINLKISEEKTLKWFNICREYYTEGWRKYHSFNHIFKLVKLLEEFSSCKSDMSSDRNLSNIHEKITVFLSIIFHDIVYTPSRNDNEEVRNI